MQERAAPAGSRLAWFERFSRHTNPQAQAAVQTYAEVAQSAGLSATQLALPYVNSRLLPAT